MRNTFRKIILTVLLLVLCVVCLFDFVNFKESVVEEIEENEEIISASENEIIVEGHYYNTFFAMQRMLYFGKNCIVLEPDGFKKKLIEKIKEMKNIYEK